MKKKFLKSISTLFIIPSIFGLSACKTPVETPIIEEESITEVNDSLELDVQEDSLRTVPDGYPDPNTSEGKAVYDSYKSEGLDMAKPNQHNHDEGWKPWGDNESEKSTLPGKADKYYLTSDILLTKTWNAPQSKLCLCLNGHTISIKSETNSSIMYLNTFAYVQIFDCSEVDTYFKVVKGGAWEVLGVDIQAPSNNVIELEEYNSSTPNGKVIHTTGGCITGGTFGAIRVDRNVYFSACSLDIFGGNIVGNTSPECGGGVNFGDSCSTFGGGAIVGNYAATSGGGIALQGPANLTGETPSFVMNGGIVIGNTCKNYGGGIFSNNNFKTVINGGTIKSNKTSQYGGGIYSCTKRGFTVNGDQATVIEDNEAQLGGGIYTNSSSSFTINGCLVQNNRAVNGGGFYAGRTGTINNITIKNNTASGNRGGGGGIYFRSTADVIINNATVTNNVANYGGALDISNGAKVKINGGTYTNNTAKKLGGGACLVSGCNVSVGGLTVISDNNLNGKANNLYIPSGVCISVGDGTTDNPSLKTGANIGITIEKMPDSDNLVKFSNNGNNNDASFFKLDTDDYLIYIVSQDSYLCVIKDKILY